ncbi:MAG: hypothetical protein IJN91_03320 [Alphaproteobacteria bacterium]|nr:hypothetical protein [Alphaproteobacteria bacterium]
MKIKNIMFSGFAAAIFANITSDANALTTYNLASKNYVDTKVAEKQNVLEPGDGISISNVGGKSVISAEVDINSTIGEITNTNGQTITVAEALDEKQDKLSNAETLEQITAEDLTAIGTIESKQDKLSNAETLEQITTEDLTAIGTIANKQDKLSNAETLEQITAEDLNAIGTIASKQDKLTQENAGGTNVTIGADGKINVDLTNYASKTELENDLTTKEDSANKISGTINLDEMSLEDKATKFPTVDATMSIATAMVGEISKDVEDLTDLKTTVQGLETTVGNETTGLVADVKKLQENVGDTAVSTQIENKLTDGKYISASEIANTAGGYLVYSNGNGDVSVQRVAIVNGDGDKDMLTNEPLTNLE